MRVYQALNGVVFVVTGNNLVVRISVDGSYAILDVPFKGEAFWGSLKRIEFTNRIVVIVASAINSPEYDKLELEMITL